MAFRWGLWSAYEGLAFVSHSQGRALPRALATQFGDSAETEDGRLAIEAEDEALGLRIDARTAVTRWLGESMDYGFAVRTLMGIAPPQALQHLDFTDSSKHAYEHAR